MSESDPREIKPPEKHPKATAARSVVEAIVQELPGGSIATALGRTAFRPAEEKERDRWAGEVTDRINEHDAALRPEVTITGTTAAVALWMVTTSSDGLYEPDVELDAVAEALAPDHAPSAVEEAVEELAMFGLVALSRHSGGAIVQPKPQLFEQIDPHAKGWKPREDARALAALALEMGESFQSSDLEAQSGFERRRFNPALSILLDQFDPADVSEEMQPDYAAPYAYLSGGTRVRLRRFIRGE